MSYKHITIFERSCIYQFLNLGMSIREIAKAIKRSPSTISREIKRNKTKTKTNNKYLSFERYFPIVAQNKYEKRRTKCKRNSKFSHNSIKYVESKILEQWSPEQIYQRSSLDNVKTPSTSTIYRLIKKGILPKVSMKSLRRKGNFKRPSEKRGKFNDRGRSIKKEIKVYIKE